MKQRNASLEKRLLEFLAQPAYQPLRDHDLAVALGLKKTSDLRSVLRKLEFEGKIQLLRKNRWALARASEQLTGRLSVNPAGFGFVIPEIPGGPDIFIERDRMGAALHGDRVVVDITGSPSTRNRRRDAGEEPRLEGRIARVVERKTAQIVGLLQRSGGSWYVIPDNSRFRRNVHVRAFDEAAPKPPPGHKVVAVLDPWDDPGRDLTGVVVEDLGDANAPGVDVLSILREHEIEEPFKKDVIDEAKSRSGTLQADDYHNRRDLRDTNVVTIDPEDAKDFDDAVCLVKLPNGNWQLDVHIADVSHFVKMGTKVDHEAHKRGNSIYMVDRFVPMLPPYLTSEVCSLKPNVDRLTHSARLELGENGEILRYETFPSVIHSKARFTYDQVQLFMDRQPGHGIPDHLQEMVGQMDGLARKIRAERMRNGSIDLAMPEVKCVLDEDGHPIEMHKRGASDAYHLIEEFMLLANVVVATIFAVKKVPAVYRIHPPPGEEQWAQMAVDLQALGIPIVPKDRHDLNKVAHQVRGTPLEYAANLAILRNLKRAFYSSELEEHFGLAFEMYTHFTSPIRRYPDLMVHRILKAVEEKRRPPYDSDEIAAEAAHCSETEWNASEAEDQSLAIKRLEFYADKLEKRDIGPFPALIVDVASRGLIVEITETLQRGMVAYATITDDHYNAEPSKRRAVGARKRRVFHVGQDVRVELLSVDQSRKRVDFRLAEDAAPVRERQKKLKVHHRGRR